MRMQTPVFPAIVTGIALCLLPCSAQDAGKVSLRFLSFPKSMEPVKLELRLEEGKTVDIEAPSNWLSKPVSVVSPGLWSVGETIDGPDGNPVFKEYGRVKALPSPSQIILLVRKGKDDADGFDILPLDAQGAGFSGGKFLFMNAARVDIGGVVGDKKFAVKPGRHAIVNPMGAPGERTHNTVFFYRHGDETKPFFSSRWPVSAAARSLIFFYHDPESMHIRMHTIRDFL